MIDWVAFFTQHPYLIDSVWMWIIWMQWGIAFSFILAYPLMHPVAYMFSRMDNYNFGESEYWWSNKTFSEIYPTYRSYVITYSLRSQIWFLTKTVPWKIRNIVWHIDSFSGKLILYYLG